MSSLRNAVKRITHKERSQPTDRQHLGLLEKKKDYKIRSKDYHRKQDALTKLRKKAAERNPDEFYFGMNKSKVNSDDGRHVKTVKARNEEREALIGPEAVKLMKSQDLSYVRLQSLKDAKKVERLQASLHYLGDNPTTSAGNDDNDDFDGNNGDDNIGRNGKKHTVFVESKEQAQNFDVATHFNTVPELAGRSFNRLRTETLIQMQGTSEGVGLTYDEDGNEYKNNTLTEKQRLKQEKLSRLQGRKVSKARASAYAEMEARKKRIALLKNTEAHLMVEKIVASKGRKRKVKGGEDGKPAIYKFRRKRAR
jgi:U3 small nucleolar RNA-associated protein 11